MQHPLTPHDSITKYAMASGEVIQIYVCAHISYDGTNDYFTEWVDMSSQLVVVDPAYKLCTLYDTVGLGAYKYSAVISCGDSGRVIDECQTFSEADITNDMLLRLESAIVI
ncbi:hypothetical protein GGI25_005167 [Coemansia spiralis]|uniref:Uncharacterized protein n=1 Tax=Coemansia spiralis TaxID=417178 RepID=A0A9W8G567_9FUNG|nr:hypothetical protein GGI26_005035 [Coemansia sp. RSA 1358]KAJ2672285.1 hypothetical protein GGI25_005167 [Coemansia spiralis]